MATNPLTAGFRQALALGCGGLFLPATPLLAQSDASESRGGLKVEVTGSYLKRLEQDSALPVQVITRDEIQRANWTTAAELMAHVSANLNGANNQLSLGQINSPGQQSANLRGLGDGNTLVLLNGRRLANYAFLSGTVNLGAIPLAAIERVEILKDGASSIYGTDAIAGVVNFITRKDYAGFEVTGEAGVTQRGGGDHYQATVTAGYGNLTTDRFNAFITVDWQKDTSLASREREFSRTAYLPDAGVNKLSPATFPANILVPDEFRYLNPAYASGCAPPVSIRTTFFDNPACGFDYASVTDTVPPVEQINIISRAAYQLTGDHQLFAELVYSRSDMQMRVSPTPAAFGAYPADGPYYPTSFAAANGLSGDLTTFYRAIALGPRTNQIRNEAWRAAVGLEGSFGVWSYSAAYLHSENDASDTLASGYVSRSRLAAAMATGQINPFGPSGPVGEALLQASQLSGASRSAKGWLDQIDARASTELMNLPAGALALALGAEGRRERLADQPFPAQAENDVQGSVLEVNPQSASRNVGAAFIELGVPLTRAMEALLSARYDHYSDFGGTLNPKIAMRWQPVKTVLLRAAWGTGFRAPSLPDLHTPQSVALTGADPFYADPVRCPVTGLPSDCGAAIYAWQVGGNPDLVPETSRQWTAGIVWEPAAGNSLALQYWNISKRNVISTIDDGLIFDRFDVYGQSNVIRGPVDPAYPSLPGPIVGLISYNQNVGNEETSGIDVTIRARSDATPYGRLAFGLDGTYIAQWDISLDGLATESAAGRVGPFGPIPRWRHYASVQWENGPWQATLGQTYQSGYIDASPDPDGNSRRVGSYSIWDLQGTYNGWRNATVSVGIRNLFNTDPPFTNQTGSFQVGYEPGYADPRGRTFYARLTYAFNK